MAKPKYNSKTGKEINYTVEELPIAGYKTSITNENYDYTISNINIETKSIQVSKNWIGPKLDEVTIELLQNDKIISSEKLSEKNNWTHIFENQRKYDDLGNEYIYTVREVSITNYDISYDGNEDDGFIITNVNNEVFDLSVAKKWIGPKAEKAVIRLLADGKVIGNPIDLNEENNWKYKFKNLRKYNPKSGDKIIYTINEENITDYSSNISVNENGVIITNTNDTKRDITVKKSFIGNKLDQVSIGLYRNEKQVGNDIILNEANNWTGIFSNVRKYDEVTGDEIIYSVKEKDVLGYVSKVSGNQDDGFMITNISTEKISIPIIKKWIGKPADNIIISLYADDKKLGDDIVIDSSMQWKYTYVDLPKYDIETNSEIVYSIKEKSIENYSTQIIGTQKEGFSIINTNDEKISIPIIKKWIGPASSQVSVALYIGENKISDDIILSNENNWSYTFENYRKYDEVTGEEIQYLVKEKTLQGYRSIVEKDKDNNYVITNINDEVISIPIKKVWVGDKKENVSISLLLKGEKVLDSIILSDENNWEASFDNVRLYDELTGEKYQYSIKEDEIEGYTSEIIGSQQEGFIITNTKILDKDDANIINTDLPNTGIHSFSNYLLLFMLTSIILLCYLVKIKK